MSNEAFETLPVEALATVAGGHGATIDPNG